MGRTSNEIQPFIEAHVLNELRKDYSLSVDLASVWIANHQAMDLASGENCCSGFLVKFLPKTEDVGGYEMRRRNSVDLSKKVLPRQMMKPKKEAEDRENTLSHVCVVCRVEQNTHS